MKYELTHTLMLRNAYFWASSAQEVWRIGRVAPFIVLISFLKFGKQSKTLHEKEIKGSRKESMSVRRAAYLITAE